ncbi:hypothetical protein ICW40_14935 [Actinotalea ferrariae]|uniref:hypothetical protein n=1 Tax=Actinotalea ferrariae TaxID=1386098 RepID=UPI001C8C0478|nr:hypothetical protein [Actinotalea ferrariae]MBX9246095.1 hypothetical protein [Actinotalea ferrariae]
MITSALALPQAPSRAPRASRTLAALGAVGVLAAALVGPGAGAAAAAPSGPCTDPEGVTVVVDKTDLGGEVEMGCAPQAASGSEALVAAGFTDTRDAAGLICAIDALPDPCPAEFTGSYWSYWTAEPGGAWEMAMVGPDEAVPAAGGVEGWRYSDGSAGPTVDAPAAPTQEAADQAATSGEAGDDAEGDAGAVDDGTTASPAAQEPTEADGPSPALIAGIGVVALLAVAALVVSRRRSAHGPAGQD